MTDERPDVQSAPPRARLIRLGRVLWAGVAGLVSLSYAQAAVEGATDQLARVGFVSVTGVFAAVRVVLIIAAIGAVVWIGMELVPVVVAARRGRESEEGPTPQKGMSGFPRYPTVTVGVWLIVLAVSLTTGLFLSIAPPSMFRDVLPNLRCLADDAGCKEVKNLVVTMLAGGIGSTITTISGFLKHASDANDFKLSYVPWYVGRPLTGVLLATVFYFLLQGGLLATVGSSVPPSALNTYGLAGIAALVGMFSKNAVAKLSEVFDTLFREAPSTAPRTGPKSGAADTDPKSSPGV